MNLDITEEELGRVCRQWQERLRLSSWTVNVEIVRHFRLSQPDRDAEIDICAEHWFARIALLHPRDRPNCLIPHDPEHTIVHELLHLHTKPLSAYHKPLKRLAEEQLINALADALVGLHRFRPDWVQDEPPQEVPSHDTTSTTPTPAPDAGGFNVQQFLAERGVGPFQTPSSGERDATPQPSNATESTEPPVSA